LAPALTLERLGSQSQFAPHAGQGTAGKFNAGGLIYVAKKTYVVVGAFVLRNLGGSATRARRECTAGRLGNSGADVAIGAANRCGATANGQHSSTTHSRATGWQRNAGIESDESKRIRRHESE
jgi:hypothetical protein